MDVKEAVGMAKRYVTGLFDDEAITHIGLEEVIFDETSGDWKITIGFSPHWNQFNALYARLGAGHPDRNNRSYKVVRIRESDGRVSSLTDRLLLERTG